MKKTVLFIAVFLGISSFALAKVNPKMNVLNWTFRAPSLSDPDAIDPHTKGDIVYDSTINSFKGWTGASYVTFGSAGTAPIWNYTSQTNHYSASVDDFVVASSASFDITLPTAIGAAGKSIIILHNGTSLNQVYTLYTTSGQTIGGIASGSYALYTTGETLHVISDGSNWLIKDHYAETGWVNSGSITITGVTTAPSKGQSGAPSVDQLWWRRSGENIYLRYNYQQINATGANVGSGIYGFNLPSNVTADTTKQPTGVYVGAVGFGKASNNSGLDGTTLHAIPYLNSSTDLRLAIVRVISGNINQSYHIWQSTPSNMPIAFTNSDMSFYIEAKVPVLGWRP